MLRVEQNKSPRHPDRNMLILDFDGVIVDTERVHFESWNAAFDQIYGVTMSGDHTQIVGLSLDQLFAVWQQHQLFPQAELTDADKKQLLECKTKHFYEIGAQRLQPMVGLDRLIETVRRAGWYVAIASRSRRLRLLKTLEIVQITTPFDLILATEDGVNPHTDRKEHDRAARVFGIDPQACIVIEDSPAGVADAIQCGIGKVIGLTTSFKTEALLDAGAHQVVDSLAQVTLS